VCVVVAAMQSGTCAMQAVDHCHVIRPNRPQLSKQAGVCSDGAIDDVVGIVSECATHDSNEVVCDSGRRISPELNVPINGRHLCYPNRLSSSSTLFSLSVLMAIFQVNLG